MNTVQIPAALAVEVAARPDRFKPKVGIGQEVLVLSRFEGYGDPGHVGPVLDAFEGTSGRGLTVADGTPAEGEIQGIQSALAWAIVGSVDTSDTAPPAAGRILVLDRTGHFPASVGKVGHVVNRGAHGWLEVLIEDIPEGLCRVGHWAILPPDPDVERSESEWANRPGVLAKAPARWRVGNHNGRTLYLDGQVVGLVDTAELAALVVEAMNEPGAEIRRLNGIIAQIRQQIAPEAVARPSSPVRVECWDDVTELADVLLGEFGGPEVGERAVHAAVRVLREQRHALDLTTGERRASLDELGDVLVRTYGDPRPSETTVRMALRVLADQRNELAQAQDRAQHHQNRAGELAQELVAVRELLTHAQAETAELKAFQDSLTHFIPEEFGAVFDAKPVIIERFLAHQANLVKQLANLIARFNPVTSEEEGPQSLATAVIETEALETLRELVEDVKTDG